MNFTTNNSTTVTLKKISLFFLMGATLCLSCFSSLAQRMDFHKVYFHPHQQLSGNYTEVKENNLPIKGTQVLYQSSDQTVWIGTDNDGVISYTGNAIKHYRFDPNNKNSLSSNRIEEIWEESPTVLWITTNDGIVKFDRLANRFTRFSAKTRFVRRTPDGALYTSVFGEGLFRIDALHHRLINAQQPHVLDEKGNPYAGETVKGILKMETDKDGILWAVGYTKTLNGLFHFEPRSGYWTYHEPATFNVQPDTSKLAMHTMFGASTLFIDAANHIWFGGWNSGLLCYDKKNGQWQQYSFYRSVAQKLYDDNVVMRIYPLNKNELWITSSYNGFVFNCHSGTVYNSIWSNDMDSVLKFGKNAAFTLLDHCGNRWIATSSNIYKSNPVSNSFSTVDKGINSLMKEKVITAFYQIGPQHYLVGVNGPKMEDASSKT
ncbi:MAG: hypothetical protein M3015_02445, partial [Bacteroidota bacterium]|nr:hypothetical protein [Bacteroidota bacterium]